MNPISSSSTGLLGSGTCRISHQVAQNSAYVRCGPSDLLIIDVGSHVPARIAELNLLEGVERLTTHLSHLHIDHVTGIFGLLQGLAWSDDARDRSIKEVTVRCTHQVADIFQTILAALGQEQGFRLPLATNYKLDVASYPNDSDVDFEVGGIVFSFGALAGIFQSWPPVHTE